MTVYAWTSSHGQQKQSIRKIQANVTSLPSLTRHFTYISMELREGVEHIKSVHVNDSSVDCELRSKAKVVKDN